MLRRAGLDTAAGDEIERVEISVLEPEDLEVVNNGSGDGSSFNRSVNAMIANYDCIFFFFA